MDRLLVVTCARASLTGEGKVMCTVESGSSEKAFSNIESMLRIIYKGCIHGSFPHSSDTTSTVAQLQIDL